MPTECNAKTYGFARVESRAVVASFDGGAVTSDAGALLLGATDPPRRRPHRLAIQPLKPRSRLPFEKCGLASLCLAN